MLPLDNPETRTLLIRSCTFAGRSVTSWDADLVPSDAEIDDDLKKDILGARRKLLFVEGTEKSLDKTLYSLIFPDVSVISKSSCRDVEHAVSGIREADTFHWVRAFGIVDNDRRASADIAALKDKGIYVISVFSVESIYYHPDIQRRVAERHTTVTGEDAVARLQNAKTAALAAIRPQIKHLSERVAEKAVREEFFRNIPGKKDIAAAKPINISIDIVTYVGAEQRRLQQILPVLTQPAATSELVHDGSQRVADLTGEEHPPYRHQAVVVFDHNGLRGDGAGDPHPLGQYVGKVHPHGEGVVEQRLGQVEQRVVPAGERGVEVDEATLRGAQEHGLAAPVTQELVEMIRGKLISNFTSTGAA